MQICQEETFNPITLTLESEDEAQALWEAINVGSQRSDALTASQKKFLTNLSDWFSNVAKL